MIKSFKILKTYYKFAKVKFILLFFEFIFLLVPSILSIVTPVVAANIISSITVYDFNKAIFWLSLEFSFIIVSAISYFLYHIVSTKVNKTIILNFQNYIYSNVSSNKNINRINLSTIDNIWVCVDFNKDILYKLCFFIKSVILLSIIIYFNLYIGLIIFAISIVTFFLLQITDKKIQRENKQFSSLNSESLDLFNSIQQNISNEPNETIIQSLKDKYFGYVEKSIHSNNKTSLYYNINNNIISLILKTTVFISTIYLITQVKTTILTLSLYLILTPYLTSSSQNLISFFELFSKFGVIENILKEFDSLKFKQTEDKPNITNFSTFNLYFYQVSQENQPAIKNFTFSLPHKKAVVFVGEKDCGKKLIFYMLQKKEPLSKGSIFIDDKNINDICHESYNKIISFATSEPYFYNISIAENLYMVCQNKSKITKAINHFGLKQIIDKLSHKQNTIINNETDKVLVYFLDILRSYLSGAKIICIYECPENLSTHELSILKQMLEKIKKECSLVLFSHTKTFNFIADYIKNIKNGIIYNSK